MNPNRQQAQYSATPPPNSNGSFAVSHTVQKSGDPTSYHNFSSNSPIPGIQTLGAAQLMQQRILAPPYPAQISTTKPQGSTPRETTNVVTPPSLPFQFVSQYVPTVKPPANPIPQQSSSPPLTQATSSPQKVAAAGSSSASQGGTSSAVKRPRKVAKLACVHCRKAHACCEDQRPCSRCQAHGLECQDVKGKKRGRKKKSQKEDEGDDDGGEKSDSKSKRKKSVTEEISDDEDGEQKEPKKRRKKNLKKETLGQEPTSAFLQSGLSTELLQNQDYQQLAQTQSTPQFPSELTTILFKNPDTWFINNNTIATNGPISNFIQQQQHMHHMSSVDLSSIENREASLSSVLDTRNIDPSVLNTIIGNSNPLFDSNLACPPDYLFDEGIFLEDYASKKATSPMIGGTGHPSPAPLLQTPPPGGSVPSTPNPEHTIPASPLPAADAHEIRAPAHAEQVSQEFHRQTAGESSSESSKPSEENNNNNSEISKWTVGPEVQHMLQESANLMQEVERKLDDKEEERKPLGYMEYFSTVFPPSALQTPNTLTVNHNQTVQKIVPPPGYENDEAYKAILQQNEELRRENARKTNELNMLSVFNEQLRSRLGALMSQLKTGGIKLPASAAPPAQPPINPSSIMGSIHHGGLRTSYQELDSLMRNKKDMDSSTFGIMICFPGGRLVSINKKLLATLGYSSTDVFTKLERWEDVIHPKFYSTIVGGIIKCLRSPPAPRKSFVCDVACRTKDGSSQPARLSTCIVGSKNGFIPVFAISYFLFPSDIGEAETVSSSIPSTSTE